MNYLYKVVWCNVCNQGWIEIVKEVNTNKIYLCCSECETEWDNPEELIKEKGTNDKYGISMKPTLDEIKKVGWEKYIKKNIVRKRKETFT